MADTGAPADSLAVALAPGLDACAVLPTTGAAALAVGTAVDLIGVGDWEVFDAVGVAAPVGEVAGFVAVGSVGVPVPVGDASPPAGAVGCSEGFAVGVDWVP